MTLIAPFLTILLWKFDGRVVVIVKAMIVVSSLYAFKVAYDEKFIVKSFDM